MELPLFVCQWGRFISSMAFMKPIEKWRRPSTCAGHGRCGRQTLACYCVPEFVRWAGVRLRYRTVPHVHGEALLLAALPSSKRQCKRQRSSLCANRVVYAPSSKASATHAGRCARSNMLLTFPKRSNLVVPTGIYKYILKSC